MKFNRIILNSARVIGLAAGFLWIFILLSEGFSSSGVYNRELVFLFLLIAANFISVVIALWAERLGGGSLVFFSVVLCGFAFVIAGRNKLAAVAFSGFPFLVSGVLFLVYSARKNK